MKRATILAVLAALLCVAATKKEKLPTLKISIHAEGDASDGEKFVVPIELMNHKKSVIEVIPLITEKEIVAFHPFDAKDGTKGAYLKLDSHGTNLLQRFTLSERGKTVVVLVNMQQVANLVADRPIQDGILTIPYGLSQQEIDMMDLKYRRIGKEADDKQKAREATKKILAGDIDKTEDSDRAPSRPTPTPIPSHRVTPTPSPSPTPKPKR